MMGRYCIHWGRPKIETGETLSAGKACPDEIRNTGSKDNGSSSGHDGSDGGNGKA